MKAKYAVLVVLVMAGFTGCASIYPTGSLYTDVKIPMEMGSDSSACPKTGVSKANTYLSLFAVGDASIQAAAQNGGITKINTVDWDVENLLGILGTYKTTVCGE